MITLTPTMDYDLFHMERDVINAMTYDDFVVRVKREPNLITQYIRETKLNDRPSGIYTKHTPKLVKFVMGIGYDKNNRPKKIHVEKYRKEDTLTPFWEQEIIWEQHMEWDNNGVLKRYEDNNGNWWDDRFFTIKCPFELGNMGLTDELYDIVSAIRENMKYKPKENSLQLYDLLRDYTFKTTRCFFTNL
jgi:hypothetical protein